MNVQDIHLMYNYNYWATGKILEASNKVTEKQFLAPASFPFGGLRWTLVHILDAEFRWRRLFEIHAFTGALISDHIATVKSVEERVA